MIHPEIILLPITMRLEAHLSVYSMRLRNGTYSEHVKYADPALNAQLEKLASGKGLLDWRRIFALLIVFAGLFYIAEVVGDGRMLEGLSGLIYGMYATLIGRHLFNIALFRYLNRHPEAMQGEITYASSSVRFIGALDLVRVAPLVLLIVFWCPRYFSYGLVGGYVLLWLMFLGGSKKKSR